MNILQNGDVLVAVLPKEIDHHAATQIREEIDRAMLSNLPRKIMLDFSEVSFMDSSGVGLVMGRYKKAVQIGGTVEITHASGRIKDMFQISGITKLVEMR